MNKRLTNIFLPNKLRHNLQKNIEKIEFKKDLVYVFHVILIAAFVMAAAATVYFNFLDHLLLYQLVNRIIMSASVFLISFAVFYLVFWSFFAVYIDLALYKRVKLIEESLPDYLEFTAANLRAGMPIDRALWLAIRPRFGPLAAEMERVAKDTMSGEELSNALIKFSKKYNSPVLTRTVSLLNEGLDAGGRISELITKIAWNLNDVGIIKKEISASVLNYVIFIGFATIIAAPILFSLCSMLLFIISGLGDIMPTGAASATGGIQGLPVGFFKSGITARDFGIYAYLSLSVTAVFSSMIISIIRKGRIKDGLKFVPVFLISALLIFTIAKTILETLFGGVI